MSDSKSEKLSNNTEKRLKKAVKKERRRKGVTLSNLHYKLKSKKPNDIVKLNK